MVSLRSGQGALSIAAAGLRRHATSIMVWIDRASSLNGKGWKVKGERPYGYTVWMFLFDMMNFSPNLIIHLSKTQVNLTIFWFFLKATPRSEVWGIDWPRQIWAVLQRRRVVSWRNLGQCWVLCSELLFFFLVQMWNGLFDGTNKDTNFFLVLVGIMESLWWRPYLTTELDQKMPPWPAFQDSDLFSRAKGGRSGGLAYVAVVALLGLDYPTFQQPTEATNCNGWYQICQSHRFADTKIQGIFNRNLVFG